jgi:hypothetical protein
MKQIFALIFFGSLMLVHPAQAQANGNALREDCEAAARKEMGIAAGMCVGFINGYQQLAVMMPPSAKIKLACWPDGATPTQIAKIVVKYLDQHPEKLHLPAAQLVYDATQEAFPCSADPK